MIRIVADLGNSRLKWGRLDHLGRLTHSVALPIDDEQVWGEVWDDWTERSAARSTWAVSSVNPPVARRLGAFLEDRGALSVTWYRSAAEVPVTHELEQVETAGADRALAVLAARKFIPPGRPGLVVSCGTAITIERITIEGVWQGGVIAPGLALSARALHLLTAQLPLVGLEGIPPAWGRSTRPALEAGLFWGVVGGVRELLARQALDLNGDPWIVWTGGDAERIAGALSGADSQLVADLVLLGLSQAAFRIPASPSTQS